MHVGAVNPFRWFMTSSAFGDWWSSSCNALSMYCGKAAAAKDLAYFFNVEAPESEEHMLLQHYHSALSRLLQAQGDIPPRLFSDYCAQNPKSLTPDPAFLLSRRRLTLRCATGAGSVRLV